MRRLLLIASLGLLSFIGYSQHNLFTVSGGYSFCKITDTDIDVEDANISGSGWRINGLYEINPHAGKVAYGLAIGYISVNATYQAGLDTTEYKLSTVPVYFAPKFLFGNKTVKGFVKGILGLHSTSFERTGTSTTAEVWAFGLYCGAGAGLMVFVTDQIFLNAEYELSYMSNSYYGGGLMHSAMGGIGIRW